MSVLRRGYVPVEPDTKGFDTKLGEQLRKQDPGGKAGKQIGGQLNRALKRLDLAPIDVKADPRQALAAIATAEGRLQKLAREAPTVELKLQTERALSQLGRFRKQLGDIAPEAAQGFAARFSARLGPLMASMPLSPPMMAAAGAAALAAAPVVSATLAGAVVGGAGLGGIVGGVLLASRNEQVKAASKQLGLFVMGDLENRAQEFVPVTLSSINRIRQGWQSLGPDLDRVFDSSRFVEPLVDGALLGARRFLGGFADAVDEADPVIEALRNSVSQIGTVTGNVFRLLAQDADEGASAIEDLTTAVSNFVTVSGQIIHAGAAVKGFTDEVDVAIDKGRYWLEDWLSQKDALTGVERQLDLTADGFSRGSAAAQAYRDATTGTADAADFAALKQAGMTDAAIAAADASGKYRGELERVRTETLQAAAANGTLVASEENVTGAQKALTQAQQDYTAILDQLSPRLGHATMMVDGLRRASQNLYGTQINAVEANERFEAAWDSLTESVKVNGRSLDIHTQAGRANRDMLQARLTASNEMYFADINAGVAVDEARKKHEKRTTRIREEAAQLKLNKQRTSELIGVYGKIPDDKTTKLVLGGVDGVEAALENLYIYQRSLAEGATLGQVQARINKDQERNRKRAYAEGGWTGPGHTFEPAGVVHADEFVIRKASRKQIEANHPGLLDRMNRTGRLSGFATGGQAPVDTSRVWPFEADMRDTKIPSRAAVAAKVLPDGPAGGATGEFMRKLLEGRFGVGMVSGPRPGARTLNGSLSYHGRVPYRAVDFPAIRAMAQFMYDNYKGRLREAITPWQEFNVHNGRSHHYSGAVWRQHNFAGGNAHNHFAMAGGGVITEPVLGVGLRSGSTYSLGEGGRPETVTPGVNRSGGDVHYHLTVNVPAGAHPAEAGRQIIEQIKAFEASSGTRWRK